MDLVDEEDVARFKLAKDDREVAAFLDGRAGDGLHRRPHFVRDDVGESRLPEARGAVKEDMVERFLPF